MTKEDWQKLYRILDDIHSDFYTNYNDMRKGKNQKIRSKAERDVSNNIDLASHWIIKYPAAYNLLTGEDATDYGKAIVWEEFVRPTWFGRDLSRFLEQVQEKIDAFED